MYGDAFGGKTAPVVSEIANTTRLGGVLYTKYALLFQLAGLILLVAMIGAISLTLRKRSGVRRQIIAEQNARRPSDVLEVIKVPSGKASADALPDGTLITSKTSDGRRAFCSAMICLRTPERLRNVSEMAPIIATNRISPAS